MANNLQLKVLAGEEVSSIYDKCLDFLSNKGVKVDYPTALKILDKAGAQVDFDNQQVRFPKNIIETALHSVPHSITLAGSNKRHDAILPHPNGQFYTLNNTGSRSYVEPGSNTYRDVTLADVAEYGQLTEALDDIDFSSYINPSDVPEETADIHALKTIFENTSKHIIGQVYSFEGIEYLIELAVAVAGSTENLKKRPVMGFRTGFNTPFVMSAREAEIIIQSCRHGMPLMAQCLPSAGGTAPVTIAGTVLLASIEVLAILVMSQLIQPGHPLSGGCSPYTIDMVTGRNNMSNIESILTSAASVQFIKDAFHIPTYTLGFGTDSYIPDGEAMMGTTLRGMLTSLAGTDILIAAGRLNSAKAISPIELILDNTLARILKRAVSGVKVDDDTLAWKEILDTMPGGHFLERTHTLQHCREALRTKLFINRSYDNWKTESSKDLSARAVEKYRDMKKSLQPLGLPEELQKELNRIVKHADEHLVK